MSTSEAQYVERAMRGRKELDESTDNGDDDDDNGDGDEDEDDEDHDIMKRA